MTFRVGQKVVCVDDSPTDRDGGRDLKHRAVYTIRWIGMWGAYEYAEEVCVRLEEVVREPDPWHPDVIDMPFDPRRFRPIVEKKADIGFATEILRKANAPTRQLETASSPEVSDDR